MSYKHKNIFAGYGYFCEMYVFPLYLYSMRKFNLRNGNAARDRFTIDAIRRQPVKQMGDSTQHVLGRQLSYVGDRRQDIALGFWNKADVF